MAHTNRLSRRASHLESALERVANLRDIGRMAVGTAREVRRNLIIATTLLERALGDEGTRLPPHQRDQPRLRAVPSGCLLGDLAGSLCFFRWPVLFDLIGG